MKNEVRKSECKRSDLRANAQKAKGLVKKNILTLAALLCFGAFTTNCAQAIVESNYSSFRPEVIKQYDPCTKDLNVIGALETLKGTAGDYSRNAILGNNLTKKPIKIEFKNLATINPAYSNYDALGWKKNSRLFIYINQKHQNAPKEALAALLAHEALHQDEYNSINEETYAWTLEAAVWTQLSNDFPDAARLSHPLVYRENTLKKLFIKGDYTDKYIRKTVMSNPGYANLSSRSPGFEDTL